MKTDKNYNETVFEADREKQKEKILYKIIQMTAVKNRKPERILKKASYAIEKLGLIAGVFAILDPYKGSFYIVNSYNVSDDSYYQYHRLLENTVGKIKDSRNAIAVSGIRIKSLCEKGGKYTKKNYVFYCVPVFSEDILIAVFGVYREEPVKQEDMEQDVEFLTVFLSSINVYIEELSAQIKNQSLQTIESGGGLSDKIIGESEGIRLMREQISKVSNTSATIMIYSEKGTERKVVCKAVHENSTRRNESLILVNCSFIPKAVMEKELFGSSELGSDGVSSKEGKFLQAHNGTIILNEIENITRSVQIRILQLLQEKNIEPVGSNKTINIDVRIIATTSVELKQEVINGSFLQELYDMLNIFPVFIPPLRERKTDIGLLANHFIKKYNNIYKKDIKVLSDDAANMLTNYSWPGNVQELMNCIESAVLATTGEIIESSTLPCISSDTKIKSSSLCEPIILKIKQQSPKSGIFPGSIQQNSKTFTTRPSIKNSKTFTTRPSIKSSKTFTTRPSIKNSKTFTTRPSIKNSKTFTTRPSIKNSKTFTTRPSIKNSKTFTTRAKSRNSSNCNVKDNAKLDIRKSKNISYTTATTIDAPKTIKITNHENASDLRRRKRNKTIFVIFSFILSFLLLTFILINKSITRKQQIKQRIEYYNYRIHSDVDNIMENEVIIGDIMTNMKDIVSSIKTVESQCAWIDKTGAPLPEKNDLNVKVVCTNSCAQSISNTMPLIIEKRISSKIDDLNELINSAKQLGHNADKIIADTKKKDYYWLYSEQKTIPQLSYINKKLIKNKEFINNTIKKTHASMKVLEEKLEDFNEYYQIRCREYKKRMEEESARKLKAKEDKQKQEEYSMRVQEDKLLINDIDTKIKEVAKTHAYSDVLSYLQDQISTLETSEGKQLLEVLIKRVTYMEKLHTFIIDQLNENCFLYGWIEGIVSEDILRASSFKIFLKERSVEWSNISFNQYCYIVTHYIKKENMDTPLIDLSEYALGFAIYLYEYEVYEKSKMFAELAKQWSKRVNKIANELLPEEAYPQSEE